MGAILRALSRRAATETPEPTPEYIESLDPGASTAGKVLETLLTPLRLFGEAVEAVDAPTRALAANVLEGLGRPAIERSGRETFLGTAPSGRELLGLGTGQKGQFESGDIAGFLTEALVSPINLLSAGTLTTAGKLSKRAVTLHRYARAAQAAGLHEEARLVIPALRETVKQAQKLGVRNPLVGRPERSLLSFSPIFTKTNVPLLPKSVNEPALAALRGLGGAVAKSPIGRGLGAIRRDFFAPAGKELGGTYEVLGELRNKVRREMRRMSEEETIRLGKFLKDENRPIAEAERVGLRATLDAPIQRAITEIETGLQPRIRAAQKSGKLGAADRIQKIIDQKTAPLRELLASQRDPRVALLQLAAHARDTAARTLKDIARIQAETSAHEVEIGKRLTELDRAATAARDVAADVSRTLTRRIIEAEKVAPLEKEARRLTRAIMRGQVRVAQKISELAAHRNLARATMNAMPPQYVNVANRIGTLLGNTLFTEQASGVRVSELTDPLLSYVPRIAVPEGLRLAEKWLGKEEPFVRFARQFSGKPGFAKQRIQEFRGLMPTQINDLFRDRLIAAEMDPALAAKAQFFTEDIGESILRRLTDSGRARGTAHFMQGIASHFSLPAGMEKTGDMPVAEFLAKANITRVGQTLGLPSSEHGIAAKLAGTGLEGAHVPADVARQALKLVRVVERPESLRSIVGFIDQVHGLTRFGVTQLFPGFHARNETSDWMMMWLAGMRPRDLPVFGQSIAVAQRLSKGTASPAERKLWEDVIDYAGAGQQLQRDVRATGRIGAGEVAGLAERRTFAEKATDVVTRGVEKIPVIGKPYAAAMKGGLEDWHKLTLFMWARKRGLSKFESGALVRKYLRDLEDLSPWEKGTARRWVFFYSYERKIVPLMLEALFANPRAVRMHELATGEIGSRRDSRETLLPDWLRDRNPLDFGLDDQGNRIFVGLGLPLEELSFISPERGARFAGLEDVGRKLANRLAPIPRLVAEEVTGINLVTGRELRGLREADLATRALPEGARRELMPLLLLERLAPSTRFTTTLRRGLEALESEAPEKRGSFLASLGGATLRRMEPEAAVLEQRIAAARQALTRAEAIGANEKAKLLRSATGKLGRRLQELRR